MFIRIGFERLEVAKHPILKEANRMNSHKHARLTYARRLEMVQQMTEMNWSAGEAAATQGVTPALRNCSSTGAFRRTFIGMWWRSPGAKGIWRGMVQGLPWSMQSRCVVFPTAALWMRAFVKRPFKKKTANV